MVVVKPMAMAGSFQVILLWHQKMSGEKLREALLQIGQVILKKWNLKLLMELI